MLNQEEAPAIMKWYSAFIRKAPDPVNGFFAFLTVPGGKSQFSATPLKGQ